MGMNALALRNSPDCWQPDDPVLPLFPQKIYYH